MSQVAICDLDEGKVQRNVRWFSTKQVYSDHYRMIEIIASPDFGPIGAFQAKLAMGWKKGAGSCMLLDLGIHIFDFLSSLTGEVVDIAFRKSVHAETHKIYAILLIFSSGAVGSLLISNQQLMVRQKDRVEISGDGQFVIADNLNHLAQYLPDGEIDVWEPGFSISWDGNSTYSLTGYAGELQSFAQAIRLGTPVQASIADACEAMRIIKVIEPQEDYVKGPVDFAHWQSENYWRQ